MVAELSLQTSSSGLKRNFIHQCLRDSSDLPVFPMILKELEELLSNENVTSHQVADLINTDPVIAGRVLNLANSAYYASGRKNVTDMNLAVGRLGFRLIKTLVYSAVVPDLFRKFVRLDHKKFWKHSLTVAMLARYLIISDKNEKMTMEEAELAYMSGLMHDIGILVYIFIIQGYYTDELTKKLSDGRSLARIEDEAFGINHAELGARYVESKWHLDPSIVDIIRNHHNVDVLYRRKDRVNSAVYIANTICNLYHLPNGVHENIEKENSGYLKTLLDFGYKKDELNKLIEMAKENLASVEALFNN